MADTTFRVAGTAALSVDGQSYALVGDFGYRVSMAGRKSLVGLVGVHGYKENPIVAQIMGTLRDASNLSVASLNAMTNVTVVVTLANGKTIVGRNMWTVADDGQDVKSDEATIAVVWEGPDVSEN